MLQLSSWPVNLFDRPDALWRIGWRLSCFDFLHWQHYTHATLMLVSWLNNTKKKMVKANERRRRSFFPFYSMADLVEWTFSFSLSFIQFACWLCVGPPSYISTAHRLIALYQRVGAAALEISECFVKAPFRQEHVRHNTETKRELSNERRVRKRKANRTSSD